MCGIAAIASPLGARPPALAELQAMITALHHRGPDGQGAEVNEQVGLAHARLAILDLAGGAQPMGNEDGMIRVVFNGEIFNYRALRRDLEQRGHVFATHSDTEVLVHLYEEHGADFVEALNGQFALVLHDRRTQTLMLARDRVGIRPLFYAWDGQRLAIASEAKALFALPSIPRALDETALADVFSLWAPVSPRSAFKGVFQLPPGHRMVLALNQPTLSPRIDAYWEWQFPEPGQHAHTSLEESAEELRALLIDAVHLQLQSDVPVGAYLSGGLDSSIITTLVHRYSDTPLRSFSLAFDTPEFDECSHQQVLTKALGAPNTTVHMTGAQIAALFSKAVWHAEMPLLRSAPAPMLALAQQVRASGVRVVLTGEGADEVFAGYDLFKEAAVRRFLARQPESRWRPRILERLYPWMPRQGGRSPFSAAYFLDASEELRSPLASHALRLRSTRRAMAFLAPEKRAALSAMRPEDEFIHALPSAFSRWAPLERAQYIEAHTLMSGYLLSAQGDRMAMGASIEARFPFLDHRIITFANRLPPRFKLRGLDEKHILKAAFARDLPPAIVARSKQPFRAPDCASFFASGQLREQAAELLSPTSLSESGWFDPQAMQRLVAKCATGRGISFSDNTAFMAALSVQLLHAQFIKPAAPALALP